jgi:predicted Zn-dependent peptidase
VTATRPDTRLTQHTLDNGLRIVLASDHRAPAVAVNI